MPTKLTGIPALSYMGVEAPQPPNITFHPRAPLQSDYQNFNTGDLWVDTSNFPPNPPTAENIWMLVSKNKQIANATWVNFAGGNDLETLTGNVGGPVPTDVNDNINTLGDGIGITVVGNPGANTLTWSLVGGGVATQSYLTDDAQVEVPNAAGQLTVTGTGVLSVGNIYSNLSTLRGVNVNTVGTVLNSSIGQPNTTANGLQGMYALGGSNNFSTDRFMHNYGTRNTFLGKQTGNLTLMVANAIDNTCIGAGAGTSLIGAGALQGAQNCILGSNTGTLLTNGSSNVIAGNLAGSLLLTGSNNVFAGQSSGSAYTGAESSNIVIGSGNVGKIGEANIIRIGTINKAAGDEHIFIGRDCGNTTYTAGVATNNVFVGNLIGTNVTIAARNTGIGAGAVFQNLTTGQSNTVCGWRGQASLSTGSNNCTLGDTALGFLQTGNNNIVLGTQGAQNYVGAESGNIVIGPSFGAFVGDNNTLRIQSGVGGGLVRAFIQGIRGIVTGVNDAIPVLIDSADQLGTVSSSERYKDNIEDMDHYSEDILSLRCVTFNFKKHSAEIVSVGLIAEEVEDIMPQLVVKDEEGLPETVRYLDLIPMLLNEVQKLEKRIEVLEKTMQI